MNAEKVLELRKDFPILKRQVHGRPLVYVDNAATTQKPAQVIGAMTHYYEHSNANIHRGVHELAEESTQAYEQAHEHAGKFIHAKMEEIIFTRNTTESINLVAQAWGRQNLKHGDEILLTQMEHHANLVPWQMVAQETGARLQFIPVDRKTGMLELEKLDALLTEKTKMVAVAHASNVLGTINPVKEIIREAHNKGARVLVDAAQSAPAIPLDVRALDADFVAFSAHKMLGPTGLGALYGKKKVLEDMPPFLGGGDMIQEVWFDHASWNVLPWKFEAGTPAIAEAVGFDAALSYLEKVGLDTILRHEQMLAKQLMEELAHMKGVELYGPAAEKRTGVVSFNVKGVHPHDLAALLDREGIAIRAGNHCAQPLMRWLDVVATARASFYLYNTLEEIDRLLDGVRSAKRVLQLV